MTLVETSHDEPPAEQVLNWQVWTGEFLPRGPHPDPDAIAEEVFRRKHDRAPDAIAEILAQQLEQASAQIGHDVGGTALGGA